MASPDGVPSALTEMVKWSATMAAGRIIWFVRSDQCSICSVWAAGCGRAEALAYRLGPKTTKPLGLGCFT